ncbi:MAG: tyrosine-type recombinase/integrase [Microcystaceae cyanobacterium]
MTVLDRFCASSPVRKAIALWLADKSSAMTRSEYEKDLRYFFETMAGEPLRDELVMSFLGVMPAQANAALMAYKGRLVEKGLAPTTINRKLSTIKSFVAAANKLGLCQFSVKDAVKSEKLKPYRDTTGIPPAQFKQVLVLCDRTSPVGKRDYALLTLLWSNALRRNEVSQLDVGDFDPSERRLWIRGKGHNEKLPVDLPLATTSALCDWLATRGRLSGRDPLFTAVDFKSAGHRLSGDGIYKLVRRYCQKAGINKPMSPHRLRHSSITSALDKTKGNVRAVQKLSRHKNLNTLLIYDDNRSQIQLELSELLLDGF